MLAVYVQYVRGHLGTYKERGKGDWMDNKSCCQTEQRRRDEERCRYPQESPASAGRVKMMSHMLLHVLSATMEMEGRGSGVFVEQAT